MPFSAIRLSDSCTFHHSPFPRNLTWVSEFPIFIVFLQVLRVFWVIKPKKNSMSQLPMVRCHDNRLNEAFATFIVRNEAREYCLMMAGMQYSISAISALEEHASNKQHASKQTTRVKAKTKRSLPTTPHCAALLFTT